MTFDRKSLVIPDSTCFEERKIITHGDVVIGDRSIIGYGIKTLGRIFIGEHALIDGALDASEDVRIDIFSSMTGDISSGGNVYLGEKVTVDGKLSLQGDLDVGDSVEIKGGFEAKGWINIRSPIPVVIYIFIYLIQLLRMGRSDEINRILEELEQSDGETIPISESFLFIPPESVIGTTKSHVNSNVSIGKQCKILGNLESKGHVVIDNKTTIFGTINSGGNITCGKQVTIHGNVNAKGTVQFGDKTRIIGGVTGDTIMLPRSVTVEGTLIGKNGVLFLEKNQQQVAEKVLRFEHDVDVVDEVKEFLE